MSKRNRWAKHKPRPAPPCILLGSNEVVIARIIEHLRRAFFSFSSPLTDSELFRHQSFLSSVVVEKSVDRKRIILSSWGLPTMLANDGVFHGTTDKTGS